MRFLGGTTVKFLQSFLCFVWVGLVTFAFASPVAAQLTNGSTGITNGVTGTNAVSPTIPWNPPSTAGTNPTNASSAALGQNPGVLGVQNKILAPSVCPTGYLRSVAALQNVHLTVCEVNKYSFDPCAGRPGYYACGRNAAECCPTNIDNYCFPGSHPCWVPGIAVGQTRTACCISR